MKRAAVIASLVLVAVALLIGGVSADRDGDEPEQSPGATTEAPLDDDRYPLAAGPTSAEVQTAVFERAYSECASTDAELLASKYKVADKSAQGVAAVVGRAWASYFKAGPDAVQDGRDGCLQGQGDRAEAP